jgi:hypothetical protein
MKKNSLIILLFLIVTTFGCRNRSTTAENLISAADTVTVPDTGYTGIKKYYSGDNLIKEVTFKNGVRNGEMRTFYAGGQLYQTFTYINGLREDSARWYYLEGQVFRSTPYIHDTIDGTQIQYYRNGRVKAKLKYVKGLRAPFLEEYTLNGKLITGYPEIDYTIVDNYKTTGRIRVKLALKGKPSKVDFFRGEFTNGVFDTIRCKRIKSVNGIGSVDLIKTEFQQPDYLGIIASIRTEMGNNYLTYRKIELPYKDLK